MKTVTSLSRVFLAFVLILGFPFAVSAHNLTAPTGVACSSDGTDLNVDWDDVGGATKYNVTGIASYDTDGDSVADTSLEFEIGTSELRDLSGEVLDQGASQAAIPLSFLAHDFGSGPILPIDVDVRVKGMHGGKRGGLNPFSALVDCGVI